MGVIVVDETADSPEKKEPMDGHVRAYIVLDETGSMGFIEEQTITGYNEYMQTLKEKTENVLVTLVKFNACKGVRVEYSAKMLGDVPELTKEGYKPYCGTPLYDAIGETIRKAEEEATVNDKTLIIVQTDGYENASKEYTIDAIKKLIADKEEEGWTFAFIGADQNAWGAGKGMGFAKGNVMSHDSRKIGGAFEKLGVATVSYCSSLGTSQGADRKFFSGSVGGKKEKDWRQTAK